MAIIDLKQRTPDWHRWRKGKIGSSDIATIARLNPYKTPQQLYDEWITETKEEVDNEHTRRGVELEEDALFLYNSMVSPRHALSPVCMEGTIDSRFIASLDGYNEDTRQAVEIKCPTPSNFEKFRFKIPDMYIAQMNWQMMVADLDQMDFFAYIETNGVEESLRKTIPKDHKLINSLFTKACDFLERVDSFEPLEEKYQPLPESLRDYVSAYKTLHREIKDKQESLDSLRRLILQEAGKGYFKGFGVEIGVKKGLTTYDYKQMVKDGIDLDGYKKTGNEISFIKVKEME